MPDKMPKQLLTLIKSVTSIPNTNPTKNQQSAIICDMDNSRTYVFDHIHHNMTVIALDRIPFTTIIFKAKLQDLNRTMANHILTSTTYPTHEQYIKLRNDYTNALLKTEQPKETTPNIAAHRPQQIEKLEQQIGKLKQRRVHFLDDATHHPQQVEKLKQRHIHFLDELHNITKDTQKHINKPNTTQQQGKIFLKTPPQIKRPTQWPALRPILINTVSTLPLILLILYTRSVRATPTADNTPMKTSITDLYSQMDDKDTQNKPHSGIKQNFVFNWQGNAVTNPSIHYYSIKYQACDIYELTEHLEKMITHHSKICNTTQISNTEQQHLIKTKDEHHILLNKKMNIVQARRTCNSLNSKLIEAKDKTQTHLLDTFMTKHNVAETFSGIHYDREIQEFLYTNGEYINDRNSKDAPRLHCDYGNKPRTWEYIHNYATKYNYYKPIFLYSKAGTTNIITLAQNQHGPHANNWFNKDGVAAMKYPICATPRATHTRDIIFKQWQNQCKAIHTSLETQTNAIKHRIERLKPSALPKPTERIGLFGNYNYLFRTNNHTNNGIYNPTNTTRICSNYITNPNISRTELVQSRREKRSILDLEVSPYTKMIYGAIQFIAKLYTDYTTNHHNAQTNPTNEQTHEYIYHLTKQESYDNDLIQTTNFIATTDKETKLDAHINKIIAYITDILNNLEKYYKSNYIAQPTDFLTQNNYKAIRAEIQSNYELVIPSQLRENKIFLSTDETSYVMTLAIPLQPQKHKTDLFRVTPMPIWHNNTRYSPTIPHKTFGIPKQGPRTYVTTTEDELAKCTTNPYCETSKGTQTAKEPPCGINQFFNTNKNCLYAKDEDQQNWYHQLENTIYFSIKPNTTVPMNVECSRRYGVTTTRNTNLENYGTITLPFNCQAFIEKNIYRPAIRTLFQHQIKEDQEINVQPLFPNLNIQIKNNTIAYIIQRTQTIIDTAEYIITVAIMAAILIIFIIATLTVQHKQRVSKTKQETDYQENTQDTEQNKNEDTNKHDPNTVLLQNTLFKAHLRQYENTNDNKPNAPEGHYESLKDQHIYSTIGTHKQTALSTIQEETNYPRPTAYCVSKGLRNPEC